MNGQYNPFYQGAASPQMGAISGGISAGLSTGNPFLGILGAVGGFMGNYQQNMARSQEQIQYLKDMEFDSGLSANGAPSFSELGQSGATLASINPDDAKRGLFGIDRWKAKRRANDAYKQAKQRYLEGLTDFNSANRRFATSQAAMSEYQNKIDGRNRLQGMFGLPQNFY